MDDEVTAFCGSVYPRLVRALDLYCGELAVAEELAQEALARAWKNWKKVRDLDDPAAWTHRVALNLAHSWYRRKRAEQRARTRLSSMRYPSPGDHESANEVAIREAVARLPHRMKVALILRYFLDLPFDEVARLMDAPQGTVRSLVHRATARLRSESFSDEVKEVGNVI